MLKAFVELFRAGLIYKDKRLVNWDPKLLTAVSDIEVVAQTVKGSLWHFKYPIADEAGRPTDDYIVVATTRPETMLGDTAVAVHPDDERYTHLQGKKVVLPLVGRLIPIVADSYSDPEKGSGAVKITPAHDFNDFEVGARHKLPLINILDAEARVILQDNEDFLARRDRERRAVPNAGKPARPVARRGAKRVIAAMEARDLVALIETHEHQVPHGDRSGVVIEPWLTDQWYVDAKTLAGPALAAVRSGDTSFVPKNWEKTYFDWLENIQPWCISRQLWWGHRIPAWYSPWGEVYVAEDEDEALAEALADGVRRGIYSDAEAEALASDPDKAGDLLTRDEDVLDTWFSSGLWPLSTLGWPEADNDLARYYPTDVLVTGFDIIFFWVARMMMFGLHFMGKVPFRHVYHPRPGPRREGRENVEVQGQRHRPLGADRHLWRRRLALHPGRHGGAGARHQAGDQRVEGYRNFATKLWNAARFAEMNVCAGRPRLRSRPGPADRSTAGSSARRRGRSREVETALTPIRSTRRRSAAYRFVWNIFCDWHLELAKPLLHGPDGPAKARDARGHRLRARPDLQAAASLHALPHRGALGDQGRSRRRAKAVLALAPGPTCGGWKIADAEAEIGWVVDLVSQVRSVRAEMNVPAGAQIPLALVGAERGRPAPRPSLGRHSQTAGAPVGDRGGRGGGPHSVQMISRGTSLALPLEGVIDFVAERARLEKGLAAEQKEIFKIDAKLGNADFLRRAPEEVVEENQDRREQAVARLEKMTAALKLLG